LINPPQSYVKQLYNQLALANNSYKSFKVTQELSDCLVFIGVIGLASCAPGSYGRNICFRAQEGMDAKVTLARSRQQVIMADDIIEDESIAGCSCIWIVLANKTQVSP